MVEPPIVFTESQALKRLAETEWNREGDLLVSQNAFTPEAVNQYREPLKQRIRDKIGFNTQPDDSVSVPNAQKLVLNAEAAKRFFPKTSLNIISESRESGSRSV